MDKAYVYVVTNDWATKDCTTNEIETGVFQRAFSTRKKAKKFMREQFDDEKEDYYLATYDEDNVVIEEGKDSLSIYLKGGYVNEHSNYTIRKLFIE